MDKEYKSSVRKSLVDLICYPYSAKIDLGKGIDRYAAELIKNLDRDKFEIEVITGSGPKWDMLGRLMIETSFPFLISKIKADLFHAVHSEGGKTAILMKKRPLITSIHDNLSFEFLGIGRSYTRLCDIISVKLSDKIIASSNFLKNFLAERIDVDRDKINVVQYGVDHSIYHPRRDLIKKRNSIFFLGGVTQRRGIPKILYALSITREVFKDIACIIGGKGMALERMRLLSKELGLEENVKFAGFIDEKDLPRYYNEAGIFVFPSMGGFGLSTLEAMACGTPVISSNVLDNPEYLGDSAILVDPKDEYQLADAILTLLSKDGLYQELIKKGLDRVKHFSWRKMALETQEVYQRVLSC